MNEFVTRAVASCYHQARIIGGYGGGNWSYGDCRNLVNDGYAQCGDDYKCKYEMHEKLQVVEIYFDTPTFDKITRDAKTNSIAKLSLIGGTLGLLTGV